MNQTMDLPELATPGADFAAAPEGGEKSATDLAPVFDVPVHIQAVLGKCSLEVAQLLRLGPGSVLELDRKVGEAIDIYVNNRLVARGEVVVINERFGVRITDIVSPEERIRRLR